MQVNLVANVVQEISVKQDAPVKQGSSVKQNSKDNGNVKSFKDTMESASTKSNEVNKDTDKESKVPVSDKKEAKAEEVADKSTDKSDDKEAVISEDDYKNISILLSQIMDGKIDLSKLTASLKQDIQTLIKSKLGLTAVNDGKLSDAVTNLVNSLAAKQENTKEVSLSKLFDNANNTPLADFNSELTKLLEEASPAEAISNSKVNDEIKEIVKSIDLKVISTLSADTSKADSASLTDNFNNILLTLKSKLNDQAKSTTKAEQTNINQNDKVSVDAGRNLENKTSQNELKQNLQNSTAGNEKKVTLTSTALKDESANSSSGDDFLKKLLSEDKNDKFSKVSNFMTQFNNFKTDMPIIQDGSVIVNKASFENDMIKALKYMDINGVKDITVKIMPKELGEVVIKLTMENGVMKANITASNKEAYNLLNSNIHDIADKLQNSQVKIQNFNINIYEDTTFFKNNSNSQSQEGYKQKQKGSSIEVISDDEVNSSDIELSDDSALNALV